MKFVALISGGKDSIYSIIECIKNGHELIGCVHLGRPINETEESYMFQTAASETIKILVEECLQVPLILYVRKGKSLNTSLVYEGNDNESSGTKEHDEVEDIYNALQMAQEQLQPNTFTGVSSGAILSTYQRIRIENVCNRLNLTSLSYLWRIAPQHTLLQKMIADNIHAVLVRTACPPGLLPHKHLNKSLMELGGVPNYSLFYKLNQRYQFHICGEGGEYETLVLDCPIYKKRLVLDDVEVIHDDNGDDTIGYLQINKCHSEAKDDVSDKPDTTTTSVASTESISKATPPHLPSKSPPAAAPPTRARASPSSLSSSLPVRYIPHVQQGTGGLLHVSEIMASIAAGVATEDGTTKAKNVENKSEADYAVQEALEVFAKLKELLAKYNATSRDVIMVHLYLSQISHFANINQHYKEFFGTSLPPSRSCVAIGINVLPGNRRVLLDCTIQCGSSQYMRRNGSNGNDPYTNAAIACRTSKLRDVLHVQSISYWAPVCVGPYSQVNTLRSGIHFLAGQIGLYPPTMKLFNGKWQDQLQQCWKNIASVLDALGGTTSSSTLDHLVSGLIYVADHVYSENDDTIGEIESICRNQIHDNGGIKAGKIDSTKIEEEFDGYEDEETWRESTKNQQGDSDGGAVICPLLVVSIPEMPVGAIIEVEVVAATNMAAASLEWNDASMSKTTTTNASPSPSGRDNLRLGWDTGHDCLTKPLDENELKIDGTVRLIGRGCAASVIVTAGCKKGDMVPLVDSDALLRDMLGSIDKVLAAGRSGLESSNTLNVRLYYVATEQTMADGGVTKVVKDDGTQLRSSFQAAIASWQKEALSCRPASTVIPVQGMKLIPSIPSRTASQDRQTWNTFLAMQAFVVDPVHLETEMWINHGREYY